MLGDILAAIFISAILGAVVFAAASYVVGG
jgi:hypothetical protein